VQHRRVGALLVPILLIVMSTFAGPSLLSAAARRIFCFRVPSAQILTVYLTHRRPRAQTSSQTMPLPVTIVGGAPCHMVSCSLETWHM